MNRLSLAIVVLCLVPALALAEGTPTTPPQTTTPAQPDSQATGTAGTPAQQVGPDGKPVAPPQGGALANAVLARTLEEQAKQSGFQVQVNLEHWLGAGTFVDPRYYSYLVANLSAVVLYQFRLFEKSLRASATARMTYEYTLPDNETGRRLGFYDTRFGLSAPALVKIPGVGINLSPGLALVVPSSPESFNAGLITSVSASISATRSVGRFDFLLSLSGGRSFFTNNQNSLRATSARDSNGVLLAACRSGETACAGGTANQLYSAVIGSNINWRITDELILVAGYSFIRGWGADLVPAGGDQFTSKALDSNGNPAARSGLTPRDRTFAFIDIGYQINEHYSIDMSISNVQLPLNNLGQVRFPFFAFDTLADNNTNINVGLTGAF